MHFKDLFPVMTVKVLICGTNWLGDSVMSMPALQLFKKAFPDSRITMLCKPALTGLWAMHACVDEVVPLGPGTGGTFAAVGAVRRGGFDKAFVFPNSFRAALIPFLAGVPVRRGAAGHQRRWLLSDVAVLPTTSGSTHQAWEYLAIMGITAGELDMPVLKISPDAAGKADELLGAVKNSGWYGLMPGAARGSSKRWPVEHFVEVGTRLAEATGCGVAVLGAPSEFGLCADVAGDIGACAANLAGKTGLPELAAVLSRCRAVVTNDSGGMHLASATGTKVVAVFGITDHAKTGPLGRNCRIIFDEGVERSRDVARVSSQAEQSLRAIKPDRVIRAVIDN